MADERNDVMRGFDRSLPMALLRSRESTMSLFRPMLGEHDLTEQQWRVLRALASTSAPMDAGGLADATFLLAPSLSRILATLERRSVITRETPEHDRRRSSISLTESGWSVVAEIAPYSEAIYAQLESQFGVDRLEALIAELDALTEIGSSVAGDASRSRRTPAPASVD